MRPTPKPMGRNPQPLLPNRLPVNISCKTWLLYFPPITPAYSEEETGYLCSMGRP